MELLVEASTPDPGMRLSVELRCARPERGRCVRTGRGGRRGRRSGHRGRRSRRRLGDGGTRSLDDLSLPGRQVELVRAVAAVQQRTIVVVVAGSPVDLSWAGDVPGLLWCWYPGQEGGRAIADVLAGDVDPGGRLPCTMPRRLEDTPAFFDTPPDPGVLRYQEGVFCGHRWYDERAIEPAFAFGHGLSYTTFAIGRPVVDGLRVVRRRHQHRRSGRHRGRAALPRAPRAAQRGERHASCAASPRSRSTQAPRRPLRSTLTHRDLAHWDLRGSMWRVDAGDHFVWVGRSSRDLGEPAVLTLSEGWTAPPSASLG